MPVTFDQYSKCSFRCMYCFAFNQKAVGLSKDNYLDHSIRSVNPEKVIKIFEDAKAAAQGKAEHKGQFSQYIGQRRAIQWGGLADPFDPLEKRLGVGLEILRYLRAEKYPVSFSTKATWWLHDPRYRELFDGANHFHVKVSIITVDQAKARAIEVGVPSPQERLDGIRELASLGLAGVTLRFRPFIIGISNPRHLELIDLAADAGADSVSTEFFCMEQRAVLARAMYERISREAGVNLVEFYRKHSVGQGYLRLNRAIKVPFWMAMRAKAHERGMRFHVSDNHGKDFNDGGSCCGCPESFSWARGQFTNAIMMAKKNGLVTWQQVAKNFEGDFDFLWRKADGFNTNSAEARAKFHSFSMADYLRWLWNNTKSNRGVYHAYAEVLEPAGTDAEGNTIFRYRGTK